MPNWPRCQIVLFYIAVPNCPRCQFFLGAKLSSFTLRCQIVLVPNCPSYQIDIGFQIVLFYIAVPTCPGAKLSEVPNFLLLHCGAKLSWCQFVLGAKLSWCQIVLGAKLTLVAKLSSFTLRCQLVLVPNCPKWKFVQGAKLSSFTLRCQIVLMPNCPRCQIVLKYSPVHSAWLIEIDEVLICQEIIRWQ